MKSNKVDKKFKELRRIVQVIDSDKYNVQKNTGGKLLTP